MHHVILVVGDSADNALQWSHFVISNKCSGNTQAQYREREGVSWYDLLRSITDKGGDFLNLLHLVNHITWHRCRGPACNLTYGCRVELGFALCSQQAICFLTGVG